jgi:hypothetical protein
MPLTGCVNLGWHPFWAIFSFVQQGYQDLPMHLSVFLWFHEVICHYTLDDSSLRSGGEAWVWKSHTWRLTRLQCSQRWIF